MEWTNEIRLLRAAGVAIDARLTATEVRNAEKLCQAAFPEDLRSFLAAGLPTSEKFPNWRTLTITELGERLDRVVEGALFDVETNDLWWPHWGPRPSKMDARLRRVRKLYLSAPRLIPVFSHRFLPAEPSEAGNPIFSIHQTDTIIYGNSLRRYLYAEFSPNHHQAYIEATGPDQPRHIRFWSEYLV